MRRITLLLSLCLLPLYGMAQRSLTAQQYADKYSNIAIEKMEQYGIPASITLGQGILESGYGGSELAISANNHFGIKCGGSWKGARVYYDDDNKGECFRKYSSVEESFDDHTDFLISNSRYNSLFKLESDDYKGWAHGLKRAGYATNPQYAILLIEIIERHELNSYDRVVVPQDNKPQDNKLKDNEKTVEHISKSGDGVRKQGTTNGVKYVIALKGDSWEVIAKENKMSLNRLLRLNDLPAIIPLSEGDHIYVKGKKGSNKTASLYTAQVGDSRHSLSQRYAIRLSALTRLNPDLKKREIRIGDLIRLN